jgi:hypothetical protein
VDVWINGDDWQACLLNQRFDQSTRTDTQHQYISLSHAGLLKDAFDLCAPLIVLVDKDRFVVEVSRRSFPHCPETVYPTFLCDDEQPAVSNDH